MSLVILERHKVYAERLSLYISRMHGSPFIASIYLEHPVSWDVLKNADVILMTSSLLETYKEMTDCASLLILDEEGGIFEGCQSLYKYQEAACIYDKALDIALDSSGKKLLLHSAGKKGFEVTAVYTPVSGEAMCTKLIDYLRRESRQQEILYINTEPVSLFYEVLGDDRRAEGISEVVYYVKQQSRNLGNRIERMAVNAGFEYLMPATTPADIGELKGFEWKYLLECIEAETKYSRVMIDFGQGIPGTEILDICNKILVISGDSPWEQRLIKRFRELVEHMTGSDLGEKIIYIDGELPMENYILH